MKKRIFKIAAAVVLVLCVVLSTASCANTAATLPDAESAGGNIAGTSISWDYNEDTKTLSIVGQGAIPNFASSEEVAWYSARHSIEKIDIAEGITAIGDYAFYYTPKLADVNIPATVLTIGKLSFAFCSSLKTVSLPDGLTSIGDACFEACTSLEAIFVPAAVTSMGERAFMNCVSLKDVIVMAQLTEIKALTFKGCKGISTLCFNSAAQGITVADNAFSDASRNFASAEFTESLSGNVLVTVNYVYADGSEASPAYSKEYPHGESYSVVSPTLTGYTPSQLTVSGTITTYSPITVTVTYNSDSADTEADTSTDTAEPVDDDGDDGVSFGTIVAVVILVVLIAAVGVIAVFMIRADKQGSGNKGGVKKTDNKNGKKK